MWWLEAGGWLKHDFAVIEWTQRDVTWPAARPSVPAAGVFPSAAPHKRPQRTGEADMNPTNDAMLLCHYSVA